MKIITRATLAAEAAGLWARQYRDSRQPDKFEKLNALLQLGPSPDPDAVDSVVGNSSWTRVPKCDGCGTGGHPAILLVKEGVDYESDDFCLCKSCAEKAAEMMRAT